MAYGNRRSFDLLCCAGYGHFLREISDSQREILHNALSDLNEQVLHNLRLESSGLDYDAIHAYGQGCYLVMTFAIGFCKTFLAGRVVAHADLHRRYCGAIRVYDPAL